MSQMIRAGCLILILGVMADQLLLDGFYTAVVLRMFREMRLHFGV